VRGRRQAKRKRYSAQMEEDADVTSEKSGSGEDPEPVRVMREYWGPSNTAKAFSQRLFDVLFSDNDTLTLVGEDVLDGFDNPFESNPFYSGVLRDWRVLHLNPPPQPVTKGHGRRVKKT
jgi:hypothetical protein